VGKMKLSPPVNPHRPARPSGDELGVGFSAEVVLKRNVVMVRPGMLMEREGKRYVQVDGKEAELPPDADVVMEGDPLIASKLDVVVMVHALRVRKSLLMPNGQLPPIRLPIAELGRISLDEFQARTEAVIREQSTTP
jgi:hypothetical protein